MFIADYDRRIQRCDPSGNYVSHWGTFGTEAGQFKRPTGVAINANDIVYVTDRNNARVQMFETNGLYLGEWGSAGSGPSSLGDFIPDTNTQAPSDAASYQLLKEQVDDVLESISERERRVLQLRFGLEDGRSRTLEEVGREFGVTRERIRQIEAKALRKLRHPTRSGGPGRRIISGLPRGCLGRGRTLYRSYLGRTASRGVLAAVSAKPAHSGT